MNEILVDLACCITNIRKFYYEVNDAWVDDNQLSFDINDSRPYERRFVAELKSQFDQIIEEGRIMSNYDERYTDFELPKRIKTDNEILSIYIKIRGTNEHKSEIKTIPDFFIHKEQENMKTENQLLVVEVKTALNIHPTELFMDWFKSCVYVKYFNYQVAVSLILNNSVDKVKSKVKEYFDEINYLPEECIDKVWLFIKPGYNEGLTMIKLSDLRDN